MIIIAARPGVGKSTLGLDFARSRRSSTACRRAIFSLEMSKHEITMRLLSAEARVPLHHMRAGTLSDEDWTSWPGGWARSPRRRCSSTTRPNMTMMEIRAKAAGSSSATTSSWSSSTTCS